MGGDQELIVTLRARSGESWGTVTVYREPGAAMFRDEETDLLRAMAPILGDGARRALLIGEARDPEGPHAPSLLVLSATGEVESSTPGVERWVSDLPGGDWDAGRLPQAVMSVAAQAMRSADGRDAPGEVALARVLSHSGTWVVLHGATMVSEGPQRVAVIVEPAHARPDRAAPDGGLRPDRARAGGNPARAPGRLHSADRRAARRLTPHGAGAPEAHLREDRRQQPP